MPFEISLRKERWLFIGIYKPPSQNSTCLLNILPDSLNRYSMQYDRMVVLGDFSLKPNNPIMLNILNDYGFTDLIKRNTCFKGDRSCIDLILSNREYSFKFSTTFGTG